MNKLVIVMIIMMTITSFFSSIATELPQSEENEKTTTDNVPTENNEMTYISSDVDLDTAETFIGAYDCDYYGYYPYDHPCFQTGAYYGGGRGLGYRGFGDWRFPRHHHHDHHHFGGHYHTRQHHGGHHGGGNGGHGDHHGGHHGGGGHHHGGGGHHHHGG